MSHEHKCATHGVWACHVTGCDASYDHDCEKCWDEYRIPALIVRRLPFVTFEPRMQQRRHRREPGQYQGRVLCAIAYNCLDGECEYVVYSMTYQTTMSYIVGYGATHHYRALKSLIQSQHVETLNFKYRLTARGWNWIKEHLERRITVGALNLSMAQVAEHYGKLSNTVSQD